MELVSGYGSDEDSDREEVTAPVVAVAPMPPNQAQQKKKRKKFDVSLLPPEIQAALARGESTKDSDDEEDDQTLPEPSAAIKDRNGSSRGSESGNVDVNRSELLGLLLSHEPKNTMEAEAQKLADNLKEKPSKSEFSHDDDDEGLQSFEAPVVEIPTTGTTKTTKKGFSFGYTTTETTRTSLSHSSSVRSASVTSNAPKGTTAAAGKPPASEKQNVAGDSETVETKTVEEDYVSPWFQESQPCTGNSKTITASNPPPPPAMSGYSSSYKPMSHILATAASAGGVRTATGSLPVAGSIIGNGSSNNGYSALHSYGNSSYPEPAPISSMSMSSDHVSKKRKNRDMELQLMAGDLSALQGPSGTGGVVQDISVDRGEWNSFKYTEQQQREKEIRQEFGGNAKNLSQVSKTANRKHQLNSLAMKAAETELAMLEKRGNRNLSKSQTQGKYGW